MYLSSEPLGMNSYTRALLGPSEQNPTSRTTLRWWIVPRVDTSLMKSSPSTHLELLRILTATWKPPGSRPLKTAPKPPWPSFSLKWPVIATMSV
ncbi:rust resistance kinase Lr10-like isoform X2 [Iris pallida]|uniref:Rust resistance kinase Lr10-like isoform X2 n=1 Tax=Iris pallida TaxID=29817 RepID=A0AAX6HWY2_IRIPA|nr:rust resistance kinase Lr10-like isoform X2 [Iris pallida]